MPLSDYAVRISYPYSSISRLVRAWSLHAKRMVFYEHNDDGAARIHCHCHIEDCDVSSKRLSQLAEEAGVKTTYPIEGKRNGSYLAFRRKEYDKHPSGYAYLTKGKYEASYIQGWTKEDTDNWKATWVIPTQHIKQTPWKKLYEEYLPYSPKPVKIDWEAWANSPDAIPPQTLSFSVVEDNARKWLRNKIGAIWCPQYNTQLTCIVKSFCWNHNISIPKGWKAE